MTHKKMPTVWAIEHHTTAKHQILEEYLKAWFPILAGSANRIIYLDGFAGPGKYEDGKDGSPVIALKTVAKHKALESATTKVTLVFIEKDKNRSDVLKQTLKEKFDKDLRENIDYKVIDSNFEKSLGGMLDELEKNGEKFPPTFTFIDPFGYSGFSMDLVKRLLAHDKSEVLITFMTGFINRFLDPTHENTDTELYGSKEFLDAKNISNSKKRINFLLELYEKKLKENNSCKYVRSFEMIGKGNKVVYHLIFGTKHWRGLEVMKKSMLKVDERGMNSFSDRIGFDQTFLEFVDDNDKMVDAAKLIFEHFRGQLVHINEIHKFVITDTQYLFKKEILKKLEEKTPPQILSVTNRKIKKMSYPKNCVVKFSE